MKKKIIVKGKEMNNLIASIYITNQNYNINIPTMIRRLKVLNLNIDENNNKYKIYNIFSWNLSKEFKDNLREERKNILYHLELNPWLEIFDIDYIKFFNCPDLKNFNFKELFSNKNLLKNSIFIFNGFPWPLILAFFHYNNIVVSFGSNSKRGVLSPVHHKLSQFITCIEGINSSTVFSSYHKYNNIISNSRFDLTKEDYSSNSIDNFFLILEEYIKEKNKGSIKEDFIFKDSFFDYKDFNKFYLKRCEEINKNN